MESGTGKMGIDQYESDFFVLAMCLGYQITKNPDIAVEEIEQEMEYLWKAADRGITQGATN